jgi:hypothetical protein
MAINLIFLIANKVFMIRVINRDVFWNDQLSGLQMLYPTPSKKALEVGGMPSEQDMKEYNMCKTEDELAAFIIRDCKLKGIRLIKREVVK